MTDWTRPPIVHRRVILGGLAASAASALLAACGGTTAAPTEMPKPVAPSAAPASTSSPTFAAGVPTIVSATGRTATPPKGELKIAFGFGMPARLDALKGANLPRFGMQEMLTRQTVQNTIEPWLAERISNLDPLTWRTTLRKNLKFWDGSPVTADDVKAAFQKNWATYPETNGLINKETQITVTDTSTLEFKTPQPTGNFLAALSIQSFGVHKPSAPGGSDGMVMTGPYRPTKFTVDSELILEPFAEYWGGTPPIARITCKNVPDANARVLAIQSGDVDAIFNLPPEFLKNFGSDVEAFATPSGRVHLITLNVARLPFSDHAMREAMAYAIDRAALVKIGLDGKGLPAPGIFPPDRGLDVVPMQTTDVSRATMLLDGAGWAMGADGVRAKAGVRLSFTLYSYPGRAELTPMAVSIQSQLKPLGFDIKVQEVQDITAQTKGGNYDATMSSNDVLRTGDPLYEYNQLIAKTGSANTGSYLNPQIDTLLDQLRAELDPAKRQALSRQVQEIIKADVPDIFLVVAPIVTAFKKGKVQGYVPHFTDLYFIDLAMRVS